MPIKSKTERENIAEDFRDLAKEVVEPIVTRIKSYVLKLEEENARLKPEIKNREVNNE